MEREMHNDGDGTRTGTRTRTMRGWRWKGRKVRGSGMEDVFEVVMAHGDGDGRTR